MKYIYLFFFLLAFSSCVKNNRPPVWLEIQPWILEENPEAQYEEGELSHQIKNAQVFINDQSVGIFQLPIKIPILDVTGTANVKIYPVIINNGISATKKIYPFLEFYEVNKVFEESKTIVLQPTTRYFAETQFWIEDFEDASVKIETDNNSKVNFTKDNQPAFLKYGSFYGFAQLNTTNNLLLAYTNGQLPLPRGKEVYLEMDYRSTNNLITGLIEVSSNQIKDHVNIQLNQQEEDRAVWKKIYIDLRELVSATFLAEYYEISFRAELDEGATEGKIIVDNIKLVYF